MKTRNIAIALALIAFSAVVAFGQQERTFSLVCGTNASMYPDFQRDTIIVSTLQPEQIDFTSIGNKYTATKVDGYNFLSGGKACRSYSPTQWTKQVQVGMGYYSEHILAPGDREISAGREYEVDCAPFVRPGTRSVSDLVMGIGEEKLKPKSGEKQ